MYTLSHLENNRDVSAWYTFVIAHVIDAQMMRLPFDALRDVTVVLEMRQSIVCLRVSHLQFTVTFENEMKFNMISYKPALYSILCPTSKMAMTSVRIPGRRLWD